MRLEIRLLGPLEVTAGGQPVRLSGRLRALLLALAISAGRPVSLDRLIEVMWPGELPSNPRASVQTYITRLRSALGPDLIDTTPSGYTLRAGPEEVDALRFLKLLEGAADPILERRRLGEALELWRGKPFEGSGLEGLQESEAPRLVERYLAAIERRVDLDLSEGRHDSGLVAELRELTSRYPLRESLWTRLLTALGQSGRQAEALERYEVVRKRIAEELGADPGPELQAIYADLLSGAEPHQAAHDRLVPRQLPVDISGFAGRDQALSTMDGCLRAMSPVVITAIGGAAGIGKTTLAVHWAHRVASRFPDGQLYVNLRGFDPSGSPRPAAEVLRGFLEALQVPAKDIPASTESQVGLYRSLLAGKRMLVVLDNARSAEQVRPLLPGSPGCLVVVTSRDQLLSLVAAEGARPLVLDVLPSAEAQQLLANRLGQERVSNDPEATEEVIRQCASLPLALAVVAARASVRPSIPLRTVADELGGLDALGGIDPVIDVRAVFSWSYRTLSPAAARLFRLLGLHPGPDITAPAAGSLAGVAPAEAWALLNELTEAHLVNEHAPGRYTFHDLLRAYAAELAEDEPATAHRMLDHYLHSAYAAAGLLDPNRETIEVPAAQPGVTSESPAGHDEALAWFSAEHRVLRRMIDWADVHGFDTHTYQLAWALAGFFDLQGHWHDLMAVQEAAMEAARRAGDLPQQAQVHRRLARACSRLKRFEEAEIHLRGAIEISRELGEVVGQAKAFHHLAFNFDQQARYSDALDSVEQALELFRAGGFRRGEAMALNGVGWFHSKLGNHRMAIDRCQEALSIHRELNNRYGEAGTLDSVGHALQALGELGRALECYQQALDLYLNLGDRYCTADTLLRLGDVHLMDKNSAAARSAWQQAFDIFTEIGHVDVAKASDRLHSLKGI